MSTRHWRLVIPIGIAALVVAAAVPQATAAPGGQPDGFPAFARGSAALERIGTRLPVVAAAYDMTPGELQAHFLADATLAVDRFDGLAYFDEPEPWAQADQPAEQLADPASAPPVTGPEFQLSSLPGADKTIYLDFDGHVTEGTTWNTAYGVPTIVSPPYDTDGAPDSWSSNELQVIADAWAAAAEDFAPWNVNVTTIDPGPEALRYSGAGDTRWGARVVITADTFAGCGCGGHAYLGSFDDPQDEPTFVYNRSFVGVAEAISHEVGHMLLLRHDGTSTSTYYTGHDATGSPGWAPIMGAGYYEPVTQWSKQEYFGANNTGEDDIAIISSLSNGNNFGVRTDDHGDDLASATGMFTQNVSIDGIIGASDDVDVFSFTTSAGADIDFSVGVAPVRPNLDVQLTLRDGTGAVIAADNDGEALAASIVATVPPGTYTIEVDGVGAGNPGANPPSGYTDYGSLGQYTLTGFISDAEPPDTVPPAAPTGLAGSESNGDAVLTWAANTESDLAGYVVQRDTGGGFSDLSSLGVTTGYTDTTAPTGDVGYRVLATDTSGNRSAPSGAVTVTIPVDLSQTASGETTVYGTVTGSFAATATRGGDAQSITEVDSGGKPSQRHDRAEHRWTIPASQGNQTLTVAASATDSGDGDTGFSLEWSKDGATWIQLATVVAGSPIDTSFDIGAPTGTIQVRVIDTDRSQGQRSHDTITVDFLEVNGDGAVVEPPTATMVVASIALSQQGAGKGQQFGVATVQVNDDLGTPVGGAAVTVQFSGDFVESVSGVTDANGSVTLVTTVAPARKPNFSACVASISDPGGLPYSPGTEGC